MTVFVTGGCKNGKSTYALEAVRRLAGPAPLYYVATMIPGDAEDEARIARHQLAREGMGFETLEQGQDIARCLARADRRGAILLDSVTALLANEMFPPGQEPRPEAAEQVAAELGALARGVENLVLVSDYIGSDTVKFSPLTELYREKLARLDCALAAACDSVVEVCAGRPTVLKGPELRGEEPSGRGGLRLILGGAHQGKLRYARERLGVREEEIFRCGDIPEMDWDARCIYGLERWLLACAREGREPAFSFRRDAVLICQDIFSGGVPLVPVERWRQEDAGRFLVRLAREAGGVTRVVCGIGQEIKLGEPMRSAAPQ